MKKISKNPAQAEDYFPSKREVQLILYLFWFPKEGLEVYSCRPDDTGILSDPNCLGKMIPGKNDVCLLRFPVPPGDEFFATEISPGEIVREDHQGNIHLHLDGNRKNRGNLGRKGTLYIPVRYPVLQKRVFPSPSRSHGIATVDRNNHRWGSHRDRESPGLSCRFALWSLPQFDIRSGRSFCPGRIGTPCRQPGI